MDSIDFSIVFFPRRKTLRNSPSIKIRNMKQSKTNFIRPIIRGLIMESISQLMLALPMLLNHLNFDGPILSIYCDILLQSFEYFIKMYTRF